MPRLTPFAALVALTISSSGTAGGAEPVSLVIRDLDWVTAGSAEALRALTEDNSRAGAETFTGRARPDDGRPAAASLPAIAAGGGRNTVDTPQLGVPGAVVLSRLTSGINGTDGLTGSLGNDSAIVVLLSLGAGVLDRPPVIGTPGGGVPILELGSNVGLSGVGQIPVTAVPGIR